MGTTFVVDKKVNVFFDDDGAAFYLLAEKSYSRGDEHKGRWEVYFFGKAADCMSYAVWASQFTEGGTTAGHAKSPERAIELWLDALGNAALGRRAVLRYDMGRKDWNGSPEVPVDTQEAVKRVLMSHGLPADGGSVVEIDMDRPGALRAMAELFLGADQSRPNKHRNENKGWPSIHRFLNADHIEHGEGNPEWSLRVKRDGRADIGSVEVGYFHSSFDDIEPEHVLFIGQRGFTTGWRYSTVQAFINECVLPMERACVAKSLDESGGLKATSVAIGLIKTFRRVLAGRWRLDSGTEIEVRRDGLKLEESPWREVVFNQVAEKLGQEGQSVLKADAGAYVHAGVWKDLRSFPSEAMTFKRPHVQLGLY